MTLLGALGVSLGIALLSIGFIRFIRIRFPRHYFSLGQIIINEREDITVPALFLKFLPPFAFSLLLAAVRFPSATQIAVASAFLASFLVVWPVFLCRNELLSYKAQKRIKILYLIYALYITQYVVLSLFGLFIGNLIAGVQLGRAITAFLTNYSQWNPLVQNVVGGFVGAALFALVSMILVRLFRRAFRSLNAKIAADVARVQETK